MYSKNYIDGEKWDLLNDILNILRVIKGFPLRSKSENPYYTKKEVEDNEK